MSDVERLKARAAELPEAPGIYFFKDAQGRVLYVGKARSLRDRVRTYFLPNPDFKVRTMLAESASIDYILAVNEREAAFLENNYVQQLQPPFNARLKDDKSFPYLKLTVKEAFPRIASSRRVEKDGAKYFGPFSPAGRARQSIRIVNKAFRVRGCDEPIPGKRTRPCLDYELGLCSGPCAGLISAADYRADVENARLFLEGRTAELIKALRRRMETAAAGEQFEEAARLRDLIRTVEDIRDRPRAISVRLEDQDAAGYARREEEAAVYVFHMRRGKIRSGREIYVPAAGGRTDDDVLSDALAELYRTEEVPPKLLLPFPVSAAGALGTRLAPPAGTTEILVPKSGRGRKLVELADRNAASVFDKRDRERSPSAELARVLGLEAAPQRIETFDISNTGGEESVGSMVVFRGGRPDKDEYRKFKVKTVEGPNDVASLREVIKRRYGKAMEHGGALPDLVLVDGGKGQLSAAMEALREVGLEGRLPVISLAKREEIIFTPSAPDGIRLDATSPARKLVQAMRDEAHRFAIRFHRERRSKRSLGSELDGIPGVGPKKKAALLTRFGGIAAIREADPDELAKLVGAEAARNVLRALGAGRTESGPGIPPEEES